MNTVLPGGQEIDSSVLRAINASLDLGHFHRPILQNLSELIWGKAIEDSDISLRDGCIFFGPQLTRLFFSVPSSLIGFETFFKAVKTNCSSLESLEIHTGMSTSKTVDRVISGLVCGPGLSYLREVLLSDVTLTLEALVHLASLPMLWSLRMSLPKGRILQTFREAFPLQPFPSLRRLYAHVTFIFDAGDFVQLISSSCNLESLTVCTSIIPPSQELYAFLMVVHQSSSRDTLTTVSLRDNKEVDRYAQPSHFLEMHTLLPLLQCPNMQDLSVYIKYGYAAIGNSFLQDMALAWPCLRSITLYPHERSYSCINLEGLLHLARHCRALESVNIGFDVSLPINPTDPEQQKMARSGICNESMTRLWVARSHVTDPPAVAAFVSDVFPNAKLNHDWHISDYSDASDDDEDPFFIEMCKRWEEVDNLLAERTRTRMP